MKAQAGAPDFGAERARVIKAKADLAEMDAEGRRGELLPAHAVEVAWTAVLARLRARLLVLPDRLAPLCHEETTIAGVRDQIRKAVREALGELAATPAVAAADPDRAGAAGDDDAAVALDPEAAAGDLARRLADHARGLGTEDRAQAAVRLSADGTKPVGYAGRVAIFGPGTGAPIFLLVPQVKLPKRLELAREAKRAHETVPGLIVANWVESKL